MKIKTILGCPALEVTSLKPLKKYILDLVQSKKGGYSVAINAEKIMMYRNNIQMKESIDNSILPSPDGIAVVIAYRWLYSTKTIRVDLPNTILELADQHKLRLFILGAKEDINAQAAHNIKSKFPNINICGRQNGYFNDLEKVKEQLKKADPDFVFVCLGSPKQEIIMKELYKDLQSCIFIGCGGALDVMSGKVKRAPMFYQKYGLEWFYRIMQRPSLVKRKWVYVPFMLLLIFHTLKKSVLK